MAKYIIILLAIVSMVVAQEVNPSSSLDRPASITTIGPDFSVRVIGNYFNGFSLKSMLSKLISIQQIASSSQEYNITHNWGATSDEGYGYWSTFWSATGNQDLGNFKNELQSYYNQFPQSSEVFTASLNNGYTAYYDWNNGDLGRDVLSNSDVGNGVYDEALKNGNSNFVSSNLHFYAGRNTAAGSGSNNYAESSEVQITTSSGHRYTIYAYDTSTPLVLDLDGDQKLEASNGQHLPHEANRTNTKWTEFDINGDGFDELIEWVGPNDGLLIVYNGNQKVTGADLFGDAKGYVDGYEQLATLDSNGDSKVSGDELKTLSVWQDKNGNAKVDAGEVTSVKELGISEIGCSHTNMISYFIRNNKTYLMWDWYPTMLMVKKTRN